MLTIIPPEIPPFLCASSQVAASPILTWPPELQRQHELSDSASSDLRDTSWYIMIDIQITTGGCMYSFRMTSLGQSNTFSLTSYNVVKALRFNGRVRTRNRSIHWCPQQKDGQPFECHSQSIMFDSCGCFAWASNLSHKARNPWRDCIFGYYLK